MEMPLDPTEKPTAETIKRELQHYQEIWGEALDVMKKADSFYWNRHNIWTWFETLGNPIPDAVAKRSQYHSGRAHAIIKHAVDANLAIMPKWHREAGSISQSHKEAADRVEKGLAAAVRDAFLVAFSHPPKVTGKDLLLHNYAVIYVGLDAESLTKRPERKRGENREDFEEREYLWETQRSGWNPFRIEAITPGDVLMEPGIKVPKSAIRRRKIRAYELADLTTTKAKVLGDVVKIYDIVGDPYEEIEVEERWSQYHYAISRSGSELLWVEDNTWGFQPFMHTWGGDASLPVGETFNPKWLIEQSVLHNAMDTVVMYEQSVAANHQLIQRTAFAKLGYVGDAAEAAQQLEGDIISGDQSQWWAEVVPQLAPQSMQHVSMLKDAIEEITYSLAMAGFAQTGVDTATQALIQSEAGSRKSMAIRNQMEYLYSIAGSNILRLVVRMNEEYPDIEGLIIGKDKLRVTDIGNNFRVQASFEQVDPVVFAQEKQDAREELRLRLIDRMTYHRIARHEDATGIEKGIIKDIIREMPDVQNELLQLALREEGFGNLADQRQREERLRAMVGADGQTPLFPGGPGAPEGAPEGPPPGGIPGGPPGGIPAQSPVPVGPGVPGMPPAQGMEGMV